MKKVLSVLIAVLFIIPATYVWSFYADADTYSTTGDCVCYIDGTVLTISGNGEMGYYSDSSVYGNYYENRPCGTFVTEVIIENGVTSIGSYAFNNCPNLIKVTIPESVTKIGESAFFYCPKLISITIPDKVEKIGKSAFKM